MGNQRTGILNRKGALAIAAAIAIGLTPTITGVGAQAANAAIVGGISVETFCQQRYGSTYHAKLVFNNSNGWRCYDGRTYQSVNFATACSLQRGTPNYGWYDRNNPYTLFCYT